MRNSILSLLSIVFSFIMIGEVAAQAVKMKRPSPPAEARGFVDSADIVIYYSSPAVKGRLIWGALVPYGKVWRTGANEATVFETNRDLVIYDQKLAPGKYALFTIPGEKEWTIILNSDWNQWGSFKYTDKNDVVRFTVPVEKSAEFNERLKFEILDDNISFHWENVKVGFRVGDGI